MYRTTLPCGCAARVYKKGDVLPDRRVGMCAEAQALWDRMEASRDAKPASLADLPAWQEQNSATYSAYTEHYVRHEGKV